MGTYEQRLEQRLSEFAEEKRLLRLPRPVRDRADACCDACGSTQPRILYGLKDPDSGRYYFVGNTCLKELVKRGAVLRRFGNESGRVAYEAEMGRRTQNGVKGAGTEVNGAGYATTSSKSEPSASDALASHEPDSSPLIPGILVVEAPEHYQAYPESTEGGRRVSVLRRQEGAPVLLG